MEIQLSDQQKYKKRKGKFVKENNTNKKIKYLERNNKTGKFTKSNKEKWLFIALKLLLSVI